MSYASIQKDPSCETVSGEKRSVKTEKGKTRLADTGVGPTGYIYSKYISLLTIVL
jgi:hypothetical protein